MIPSARASAVVKSAVAETASIRCSRSPDGLGDQVEEGALDVGRPVGHARLGGDHPRLAVHHAHRGVDRLAAADPGVEQPGERLAVEGGDQLAVTRAQLERVAVVARGDPDPGVAEQQRHRARDGRVGEVVERLLDVGVVDLGLRRGQGELDRRLVTVAEIGLLDLLTGGLGVERLTGAGVLDHDPGALEVHGTVSGRASDLGGELVERLRQRVLVDVEGGGQLVAAGVVVPQPRGTPGLATTGRLHRRGVVDAQPGRGRSERNHLAPDRDRDRLLGAVGEAGLELLERLVGGHAADLDPGHGRAARDPVAGREIGSGVRTARQQRQPEQQEQDDAAARPLTPLWLSHARHRRSCHPRDRGATHALNGQSLDAGE